MGRLRFLISMLVFLTLCMFLFANAFAAQSLAPDFALNDITGKKVKLSEFRGRVILLNFWATWCGPCKAEMPSLNNLYNEFKDKGFVVLAVSVDTSEKSVKSFIKDNKLSFPVLMDKNKAVSFDDYGVLGLPTTFLIDKNGGIVEKIMGEREWDSPQIKERILKLIGGKK
ncbi:thiol:disulfide interchange protein [Dissulfurispira thermophila]|uniref:Thiol:disulfide interchange protein n=2 Tax=root TaxID=1 RepID=A0A7G1GY86_9BACT|nr:redoxin domain-containing protein [Dissulfurispira thermophila]BCB95138.1 thiol:disulfide interchange protein [Dissulfurispira thermophila]